MMWLVLALLTLLSAVFVIYPLIKKVSKPHADEIYGSSGVIERENIVLYKEQQSRLEAQLADGEIDQAQFSELVAEQKRLLLSDAGSKSQAAILASGTDNSSVSTSSGAWLLMVGLLLIPLLAFTVYDQVGASDDLEITQMLQLRTNPSATPAEQAALRKEIRTKIERRLKRKPDHAFYQITLARLYMDDNNFPAATNAYQQVVKLMPEAPELLAEYAQSLYLAADNTFTTESNAALDRALLLDPNNQITLGLQGIRAFEVENYLLAITSWQSALQAINPNSAEAQALKAGILRAKSMQGLAVAVSGEKVPNTAVGINGAKIALTVNVALSPALTANPDQLVYVFAREWKGRPIPLAVAKLSVAELPAVVILDDSMAMLSSHTLSSATELEVVARVSTTGSAIPAKGDLEGSTGMLELTGGKTQIISIVIDHQQ